MAVVAAVALGGWGFIVVAAVVVLVVSDVTRFEIFVDGVGDAGALAFCWESDSLLMTSDLLHDLF